MQKVSKKILLIKIRKRYERLLESGEVITDDKIYECVHGRWRVNKANAESADYIFAVYKNTVMGVYSAKSWHECDEHDPEVDPEWVDAIEPGTRFYFTRNENPSLEEIYLRGLFIGKQIDEKFNLIQNPVSFTTLRGLFELE